MTVGRSVLVVPRQTLEPIVAFRDWPQAEDVLARAELEMQWLLRDRAECSLDFVQLIPSALIHDGEGRYLLLRRSRGQRTDLSRRLSLVFGGHVNPPDTPRGSRGLKALLVSSLRRELSEELRLTDIESLEPRGLVVDRASPESSRHAAVVYAVKPRGSIDVVAVHEYSPKPLSVGAFVDVVDLESRRHLLDPWSLILLKHGLLSRERD